MKKNGSFVPVGNVNRDKRVRQSHGAGIPYQPGQNGVFCPGCQTRDKRAPLLSRTGVPGWETGTTGVSQPGQINVFVVVVLASKFLLQLFHEKINTETSLDAVHINMHTVQIQRLIRSQTLNCFISRHKL